MNHLLTSLAFSLVAAAAVWVMGRRDPGGRLWVTVGALSVLLLIPMVSLMPKFDVTFVVSDHVAGVVPGAVSGDVPWWLVVWFSGAVVVFLRLMMQHWKLRHWLSRSEEVADQSWVVLLDDCVDLLGLGVRPEIRIMSGLGSPVVTGLKKPVVLMPLGAAGWSFSTRKMALLHELMHLRRRDLWVRTAAELACAIHWYNPLVWWLRARLFSQCEYACDESVVSVGVDRKTYLNALCEVVEYAIGQRRAESRFAGACAMADHAPLRLRAQRLLDRPRKRRSWLVLSLAILTTTGALGLTLVRPVVERVGVDGGEPVYTQDEIDLRHGADPFPGN